MTWFPQADNLTVRKLMTVDAPLIDQIMRHFLRVVRVGRRIEGKAKGDPLAAFIRLSLGFVRGKKSKRVRPKFCSLEKGMTREDCSSGWKNGGGCDGAGGVSSGVDDEEEEQCVGWLGGVKNESVFGVVRRRRRSRGKGCSLAAAGKELGGK
ncbi:hypothetical protein HAX54_025906 [Datura stramonium]|uniref:Uncharacterized protein n=1 Tax=Datura stramonium TaxID=4076 RepID=A0ABS8V0M7_DATST|nr:hypothetical protein [Datura stramonium]